MRPSQSVDEDFAGRKSSACFALELAGHEVFTVTYMGWNGVSNGQLLAKAAEEQFDAMISIDRGIEYEQGHLPCAVIILVVNSNNIERSSCCAHKRL